MEKFMARLSYAELEHEMSMLDDRILITLLDSKSVKIGDTAASLLRRRKKYCEILNAIQSGNISSKYPPPEVVALVKPRGHLILCRLLRMQARFPLDHCNVHKQMATTSPTEKAGHNSSTLN